MVVIALTVAASVHALEVVDASVMNSPVFEFYLERLPRVHALVTRRLADRLRDADRKRLEFTAYDSTGRVAARLVELAERFGTDNAVVGSAAQCGEGCSSLSQAGERPAHRPPLQHLLGSFDSLRDHLTLIDSRLDFGDIESTLGVSIEAITETLWPQTHHRLA
jgi:CRP-like cAMP-binding protein